MALRPKRVTVDSSTADFIMNAAAEPGGIVCYDTSSAASGVGFDQAGSAVAYQANASGKHPVGMLLTWVVNENFTKRATNRLRDEVQIGGKVSVVRKGVFTTNFVYTGHSPSAGAAAYVGHSGYIATSDVTSDHTDTTGSTRKVGRWETSKDQDGYARVSINLPNT